MNKFTAIAIVALFGIGHAQAQSVSTATQQSTSTSVAQGSIQFSQTPADQHLSETVRNVPSVALGAYASSFSPLGCGTTTQGGVSFAGFGIAGGGSQSMQDCVLEVAAAETARQSTITTDAKQRAALQQAAINMRCQVNEAVYNALIAAGLTCSNKPKSLTSRTDTQPPSTRIASGN